MQARAKANVYDVLNDFAILITFEGDRFAVFSSSAHALVGISVRAGRNRRRHAFVPHESWTAWVHSPDSNGRSTLWTTATSRMQ